MWLGIIAISVITVIIMSYCHAASIADEKIELERPGLIEVEDIK
ncbi:hypothetical protein [Clostridium peptidivorans]|nr:hypothetical protein [Clostridium peptidivorans]